MKVRSLKLYRFTAFEDVRLEFSPSVNVMIGENGTGKSHVLKVLYALTESVRRHFHQEGLDGFSSDAISLGQMVAEMLRQVFLPDELGRLVRRAQGRRSAEIELVWDNGARLAVSLSSLGKLKASVLGDVSALERAVFLPTREMLSIYPGFVETWLRRESAFDRTYYDICLALGLPPLRGARDGVRASLLEPIERALQASVEVSNGKFYLRYAEGGKLEAPLVAEGHRKLAMLAYLIVNGSLTRNGFMFWDEPEANMNPKLALLTQQVVFGMARLGVQSFLATHDYVLTSELSLGVESGAEEEGSAAFFALTRDESSGWAVQVERGETLPDLRNNAILDALASLHERERAAFVADGDA